MKFFWIANPQDWSQALVEAWEPGYTPREVLVSALQSYTDLREIEIPRSSDLTPTTWRILSEGRAPQAVRLVQSNQIKDLLDLPLDNAMSMARLLDGIEVIVTEAEPSSKLAPKQLKFKTVAIF